MKAEKEDKRIAADSTSQPAGPAAGILEYLRQQDVDVMGVADMDRYGKEILGLGDGLSKEYPRAICFGMAVSRSVLDTLTDGPTIFYLHHYRQINYRLDMISYLLGREIERRGFRALPIAASQMVDWQDQKGHISHKHVAVLAGLGWTGRNNLLVNPGFGAQLRYNSVLTDMPLEADAPLAFGCAQCHACVRVCPAGAIKEEPADFDHKGCFAKLKAFKNERNLGQHICGICVKACGGHV